MSDTFILPKYWPFILPTVYVWNRIGYSSIIFFVAVIGIDRELYEAAVVDGANKARQVMHITPMLKPTIIILVLIHVGCTYADWLFYQVPMNSGALFDVTNVIDTYVYRALLQSNDISKLRRPVSTSPCRLYHGDVTNQLVRKIDPENALF